MSGLSLGANTFSYIYTRGMLDCVQHLGTMGYREFEILVAQPHFWATDLTAEERHDIPKRLADQRLHITSVNVPNTWIPRAENVMEALDALGRDDVGIIYDVANAPFAGEDPRAGVRVVKDRLKLVHLSDTHKNTWRHDPIGMGDVPFAEFNQILRDIGYEGISMLELITDDPDFHFIDSHKKLVDMGWDDFLGVALVDPSKGCCDTMPPLYVESV